MLLFERMLDLVGTFFDVRQIWGPPTKRRLASIASISPDLHALLTQILSADDPTTERVRLAHLALPLVFDPSSWTIGDRRHGVSNPGPLDRWSTRIGHVSRFGYSGRSAVDSVGGSRRWHSRGSPRPARSDGRRKGPRDGAQTSAARAGASCSRVSTVFGYNNSSTLVTPPDAKPAIVSTI